MQKLKIFTFITLFVFFIIFLFSFVVQQVSNNVNLDNKQTNSKILFVKNEQSI